MMHQAPVPPPPPPPAPPLSGDLFSRLSGRLHGQSSLHGKKVTCSRNNGNNNSKNSSRFRRCQKQLTPQDVARHIAQQFQYCLPHSHGESELHKAAFEGDTLRLRLLLEYVESQPPESRLVTLNQKNRLGCTPSRLAATGGHCSCLQLLIKSGADLDLPDVKGQTALFVAIKNKRHKCAELLLQSGACPEGDCLNSSTPLHIAFMQDDIESVLLLLRYDADPDMLQHLSPVMGERYQLCLPFKMTSLVLAVELLHGSDVYRAVRVLMERGVATEGFTYHTLVSDDHGEVVRLMHAFGVRSDVRDSDNKLATDVSVRYPNKTREILINLQSQPRSLMSACRVAIAASLPRPRPSLNCLDTLPLPRPLLEYLKFPDV